MSCLYEYIPIDKGLNPYCTKQLTVAFTPSKFWVNKYIKSKKQ